MQRQDFQDEENAFRSFQLSVLVLEARHLVTVHEDSHVVVSVGKERKTLKGRVAIRADAPQFNGLCTFDFCAPVKGLLEKILRVAVYGVPILGRNKLVGSFSVELSTIWEQPSHRFHRKWACLSDPKNPADGVKGYLKCDIGLLEKGTKPTGVDKAEDHGGDIEDHLMLPHGESADRQHAKFVFTVYRADNFAWERPNRPSAHARVTFAGVSNRTKVARETFQPVWNEELSFQETIPALCRTVRVEVCDAGSVLGSADLDLRDLSREGEGGFLPTYGPTFLYLYRDLGGSGKPVGCCLPRTYACRVLLALRTEVVDHAEDVPHLAVPEPKVISALYEDRHFRYTEFILFATVLDVLVFDATAATEDVSVRVNIGPHRPATDEGPLKPAAEDPCSVNRRTVTFEDEKRTTPLVKRKGSESPEAENGGAGDIHPGRSRLMGTEAADGDDRSPTGSGRQLERRTDWSQEWIRRWKEGARLSSDDAVDDATIGDGEAVMSVPSTDSLVTAAGSSVLTKDADTVEGSNSDERIPHKADTGEWEPLKSLRVWPTVCTWGRWGRSPWECEARRSNDEVSVRATSECSQSHRTWSEEGNTSKDDHSTTDDGCTARKETQVTCTCGNTRRQDRREHWNLLRSLRTWPTEWRKSVDDHTSRSSLTALTAEESSPHTVKLTYGSDKRTASDECRAHQVTCPPLRVCRYDANLPSAQSTLRRVTHSARKVLRGLRSWPTEWRGRRVECPSTTKAPKSAGKRRKGHVANAWRPPPAYTSPPSTPTPSPASTTSSDSENHLKAASVGSMLSQKTIWPGETYRESDTEGVLGRSMEGVTEVTESGVSYTDIGPVSSVIEEAEPEEESVDHHSDESYAKTESAEDLQEEEGQDEEEDQPIATISEAVQPSIIAAEEEEREMEDTPSVDDGTGSSKRRKKRHRHKRKKRVKASQPKDTTEKKERKHRHEKRVKVTQTEEPMEEDQTEVKKKRKFWQKRKKRGGKSPPKDTTKVKKRHWHKRKKRLKAQQTDKAPKVRKKFWHRRKGVGEEVVGATQRKKWIFWSVEQKDDQDDDLSENLEDSDDGDMSDTEDEDESDSPAEGDNPPEVAQHRRVRVYNGCNTTGPQPITIRGHYGYSTFTGRYPCLHLNGLWPNANRRMHHTNAIHQAVQNLQDELNDAERELTRENSSETLEKLRKAVADLCQDCQEILTEEIGPEETNLHRERMRCCRRELREMIDEATGRKLLTAEDELKRARAYLKTLARYADDPETSFPDTEVWLLKNGKAVAQHRLRTRWERGPRSSQVQSVLVRSGQGEVVAKVELFVWFGPGSQFPECLEMLPSGFDRVGHSCPGTTVQDIPVVLTCAEVHRFTCRVHVSQGRVVTGAGPSELPDPFVRVTVFDRQEESQVRRETFNPSWDETVVVSELSVHGTAEYLRENSVAVTLELINGSKDEVIGRGHLKPRVNLTGEGYQPPRLAWVDLRNDWGVTGSVLLAAELIEVSQRALPVPVTLPPRSVRYRLEVLFWGVRELRKKPSASSKVFVTLECGGGCLTSAALKNATKNLNFRCEVQTLDLMLPEEDEYKPPVVLKLQQAGPFTTEGYLGHCIVPNVSEFLCATDEEVERCVLERVTPAVEDEEVTTDKDGLGWLSFLKRLRWCFDESHPSESNNCVGLEVEDEDTKDWWVRYHRSKEKTPNEEDMDTLVVYDDELEAQPEFRGFSDVTQTFDMEKRKTKKGVETKVLAGKVKAAIRLYRSESQTEAVQHRPSNLPVRYFLRVYVVSCRNLTPKDKYGRSDPYLVLQVGSQKISGVDHCVPQQVSPVFGKCYELTGTFPQEHLLRLKVMDRNVLSGDELIGETTIDLESRYYTKHHASCGIPKTYTTKGKMAWRDIHQPSDILQLVCRQSNMEDPVYTDDSVRIAGYEFQGTAEDEDRVEVNAHAALKCWHRVPVRGYHLVPEHVEARPLHHPSFPGIEQGKVAMWVDIFPADFRYVPPVVDIEPRTPVAVELRATVWNVVDVSVDDGVCDLSVRAWIRELEDVQTTDVHYRAMNGEGNFNWRFVFRFLYVETERRLVVQRKEDAEDPEPEELRFPCRLELQVWDNDVCEDPNLGYLSLELSSMPCGAKLSTRCGLSALECSPRVNLFRIRKTRGWWPFRRITDAESCGHKLSGKVDLELEVVTEAEAQEFPVGKGRDEPNPLPMPKRPEATFPSSFNLIKTFLYVTWPQHKQQFLVFFIVAMAVVFVLFGVYAIPGYTAKKVLGA